MVAGYKTVWIQARRKFSACFGIGVYGGRDAVGSPTFEKSLSRCDSRPRRKRDTGRIAFNGPPPFRSKRTQRIVLRRDSLQIKQEVAFVGAGRFVARRQRARIGQLFCQALAQALGGKNQIRRENRSRGLKKIRSRRRELAL